MNSATFRVIAVCLLSVAPFVSSSPVRDEVDLIVVSELIIPLVNSTTNSSTSQSVEKLRQDGDGGDAAEAAGAAIGEGEIGENVANILQGVLGGGFENIFKGATGFIDEQDTQAGVSTILASLAKPLNTIFASGIQSGQNYFFPTTPATLNGTAAVAGVTGAPGTVPVAVTAAPVVVAAAVTKDPDDDDDAEAEAKLRKQ